MKILCLFLTVLAATATTTQALGIFDTIFHARDLLQIVGGLIRQVMGTAEQAMSAAARTGERAGEIVNPPDWAPQFKKGYKGPLSSEALSASVPKGNPYKNAVASFAPKKP
ncbi:uncharacterized protein [Fopius arisanus]|uniref:Tiprl_1 protein n=1 Tax=Fopius arisanus TaxID=64838 RepID=A0A0C9QBR3_9HYME|nr:PREDICTED: uncharacterized protein LOC105267503 [Fopius arisanus]